MSVAAAGVTRGRPTAMRFRLIPADLVVILAGVSAAMHIGKLPPAIPVLREVLGITLLEAGFLLSLVQGAGMVAGVFVGTAADGIGLRRSVLVGLMVLTVASVLGGLAHDATQLMVWRAVEGFGFLLAILPVPSLLRQLVAPERLNLRLGLWGTFMPVGTALALLCGPWVMAAVGWPGWWWTLAALTAVMAVWMWLAVPADLAHQHRPDVDSEAGSFHLDAVWSQRLRATLSSAGPWLVALTFAMYSSQWLSIVGFLPSIYAQSGSSVAAVTSATAASR